MRHEDVRWVLSSALNRVPPLRPVHCGLHTLRVHPDPKLAESGELALVIGDQIVAVDDAAARMVEVCGEVRVLGAIGRALSPLSCELRPWIDGWRDLAREAEGVAALPGGPPDRDLRMGLAMRAVALHRMGRPGWIEGRGSARPADVKALPAETFEIAKIAAHAQQE